MTLSQIMKERRSIQLYEDRPVPVNQLKEMLATAVWVPNHKMTQPWRFVFVHGNSRKQIAELNSIIGGKGTDIEEKKKSGEIAYNKIMDVPVFLLVIMEENPNMKLREEDFAATSCIVQNFSLLAWEQGIGMIWKTNQLTTHPEFRKITGVGRGEKVVAMLQIGYPAKVPAPRPRHHIDPLITEL